MKIVSKEIVAHKRDLRLREQKRRKRRKVLYYINLSLFIVNIVLIYINYTIL